MMNNFFSRETFMLVLGFGLLGCWALALGYNGDGRSSERHMFFRCATRNDINFQSAKWNMLLDKEHNKFLCFYLLSMPCIFMDTWDEKADKAAQKERFSQLSINSWAECFRLTHADRR
jgi:hypothetical protein